MKLIRVLEYEGSEEWVHGTLERNAVKRIHRMNATHSIRELTLGRDTSLLRRLKLAGKIILGAY